MSVSSRSYPYCILLYPEHTKVLCIVMSVLLRWMISVKYIHCRRLLKLPHHHDYSSNFYSSDHHYYFSKAVGTLQPGVCLSYLRQGKNTGRGRVDPIRPDIVKKGLEARCIHVP